MDHAWRIIGLCVAALFAGAINALAGGGTLLTFPSLLAVLAGVPGINPADVAVLANGTSTVALVPGSLAGAWGYRRQMSQMRRWLLLLIVPSVLGGAIGALLVTRLNPHYFERLVPWLLLMAALLFLKESLWPSRKGVRQAHETPTVAHNAALVLFQFGVALYGGYFGAGIGILMLSSLSMMRLGDIHQLNALKNLLACAINGVSVIVFIVDGKVCWPLVLPMAAASIIGGYVGARLSLKVAPQTVRWVVVAIGFGLAAYFFAFGSTHAAPPVPAKTQNALPMREGNVREVLPAARPSPQPSA